MKIENVEFRRLFSQNMYKDKKFLLGKMSFAKDFVTGTGGDLYPVTDKDNDCREKIQDNTYILEAGRVERMFAGFFPYATYEVTFLPEALREGSCGFLFHIPEGRVMILCDGRQVVFREAEQETAIFLKDCFQGWVPGEDEEQPVTMISSCRPGAFDLYFLKNGYVQFFHTFEAKSFTHANAQAVFQKGYVCLAARGRVTVTEVSSYIDCGISQADIRAIRYEDGTVLTEQGKVYLTASIRMERGACQGIFSWVPGTAEFELCGALFFDSGDGYWQGDVASSILYHREKRQWYLWMTAFSNGHVLGHGVMDGDPRFGVNVADIAVMEKAGKQDSVKEFLGFQGDEDPDFYYDREKDKWYMSICRLEPDAKEYRYLFFESSEPFSGYRYIGQGMDGCETGGSFITFGEEKVFVCGNDFERTSNYRIYTRDGMREAAFDFPDGGFRGWGTIIPVTLGSRKRYFWITFDRHNGSSHNWSYGNVYCFEGIERNREA